MFLRPCDFFSEKLNIGVTQLFFSNRQATENAKIFSKTPRILGVFDNFLGDLGYLAVQVRKSFICRIPFNAPFVGVVYAQEVGTGRQPSLLAFYFLSARLFVPFSTSSNKIFSAFLGSSKMGQWADCSNV